MWFGNGGSGDMVKMVLQQDVTFKQPAHHFSSELKGFSLSADNLMNIPQAACQSVKTLFILFSLKVLLFSWEPSDAPPAGYRNPPNLLLFSHVGVTEYV